METRNLIYLTVFAGVMLFVGQLLYGPGSEVNLSTQESATGVATQAADEYVATLTDIQENLSSEAETRLGEAVEAQLKMTEQEARHNVGVGIPKKYVNEAAEIKKCVP
jgi:hypothetical protein